MRQDVRWLRLDALEAGRNGQCRRMMSLRRRPYVNPEAVREVLVMRYRLRRMSYALHLFWLGCELAGNIHRIAVNQRWLDAQATDLNALADLEYDMQVVAGEKLIERELGR